MQAVSRYGKKAAIWAKELKRLEKEAIANGIFQWKDFEVNGKKYHKRMGTCPDCGKYKHLTPDHLVKRSQGGTHASGNIEWVCRKCHDMRDNLGDPKNRKPTTKRMLSWKTRHPCKHCHKWTVGLLCPNCGKISL